MHITVVATTHRDAGSSRIFVRRIFAFRPVVFVETLELLFRCSIDVSATAKG